MTTEVFQGPKRQKKKEKNKVVKLKVYKNKLVKKEQEENQKRYFDSLQDMFELNPNPEGFALIAWHEEGYHVSYCAASDSELFTLPDRVRKILEKDIKETFHV